MHLISWVTYPDLGFSHRHSQEPTDQPVESAGCAAPLLICPVNADRTPVVEGKTPRAVAMLPTLSEAALVALQNTHYVQHITGIVYT